MNTHFLCTCYHRERNERYPGKNCCSSVQCWFWKEKCKDKHDFTDTIDVTYNVKIYYLQFTLILKFWFFQVVLCLKKVIIDAPIKVHDSRNNLCLLIIVYFLKRIVLIVRFFTFVDWRGLHLSMEHHKNAKTYCSYIYTILQAAINMLNIFLIMLK